MHSLELTDLDKSWVYRPAMNAWSNDKQRFRLPDIRPIVPIESGRASLSQPLHTSPPYLKKKLLHTNFFLQLRISEKLIKWYIKKNPENLPSKVPFKIFH